VTTERLATKLSQYDGRRNTLRKVHSSWSVFFDYCARLRGIYATNPMRDVPRPKHEKNPIQFCEQDEVERIVDWQPTAERRALFALLYGTALRYRSR
jgi:site-specific recombinase XerD